MPLDYAIAAELQRSVTPPPLPSFAIDQPWRSDAAQHAERLSDHKLDEARRLLAEWRDHVASLRLRLLERLDSGWDPELTSVLEQQIELAEEQADDRARRAVRAAKDIDRVQRALRRRDPSLADVHRRASRHTLELQREISEDLLDLALFLRSIRGSISPGSRGGRTFTPDDDLEGYLRGVLSA